MLSDSNGNKHLQEVMKQSMKINGHLKQNPWEMCHTACSNNIAGTHLQEKNLREWYFSISYMRSTKGTTLNSFKKYFQIR